MTSLVSIQEKMKAELAALKKSVAPPSGRNISTRGKVFTLPNGRTHQGPLHAVILDHRNYNRYYTAAYNPQDPKPPACFALSKELTGLVPHETASGPQAESCAGCPMNKWGSAPTGKGKACRNTVRLAVAPSDKSDDEPMILSIPPTALKSWNALVNNLETMGMLPVQVVTEIAFDPQAAYPTLLFKATEAHEDLEYFWNVREKSQSLLDQPPISD